MAEPTPVNILRGHKAQIHAAAFVRGNDRLTTGDADGQVMLWDLAIMRPRAVWKAHENAILSIRGWGSNKIITHGRDHRLVVWQLRLEDESNLKAESPLEQSGQPAPQPWILHVLEVNTMNFCAFAACPNVPRVDATLQDDSESILVAVPNTLLAESIDIFELPSQKRIHTVKPGGKLGMAMTLAILYKDKQLVLVAGFENGACSVFLLKESTGEWTATYRGQTHSQPVLSLDVNPEGDYFISSSADSLIVKHPIPMTMQPTIPKADAAIPPKPSISAATTTPTAAAGIGALFAGESSAHKSGGAPKLSSKAWEDPIKIVNTKHSGQQNLTIRSDGRIFATAGWDSKIRVYATKSLKPLAVLKWHQVGVYATAFAHIESGEAEVETTSADGKPIAQLEDVATSKEGASAALVLASGTVVGRTVKARRIHQARYTHWLAAGAKDGKLSLWDIY